MFKHKKSVVIAGIAGGLAFAALAADEVRESNDAAEKTLLSRVHVKVEALVSPCRTRSRAFG